MARTHALIKAFHVEKGRKSHNTAYEGRRQKHTLRMCCFLFLGG